MGESCDCCKICCYSTPYGTIFALSITVVGLVGFLSSSIYSIILVSQTTALSNNTIILAPIVGGIAGTTLFPLILATILAYCVTGYVRDELYHPFVKACVGQMCNVWSIVLTFVYFLLWLLLSVGLTLLVTLYVQLAWACPQVTSDPTGTCFSFEGGTGAAMEVCVRELDVLCRQGLTIGLAFAISLGFSIVIIIGLVMMLMIQAGNLISVRESNKRSYRPGGDY
ncbi:uncharacterized protein LOC135350810 isoform X2 [Halichondria panicea]|uniref:uncharacterized protein LOC135350810 isoform X2 n=1 Tax=Halichondria panicea TaxID=6063 RepID=UPI00312B4572